MSTLIEQLITKMGLKDEPSVMEKTTELVRLLELRSSNVPLQINEYGKIVICADLASCLLSIGFDKEQALKLSGLRKSHYVKNKRMFEKLLDLNKLVTVNDICVQLGLNEVARKAGELMTLFKAVTASENTEIDTDHPQYAAIAVFHACRLLKQKVAKPKLMPFSNLRPTQWQQLELQWDRMIAKHYKDTKDTVNRLSNLKDKLNQENIPKEASKKSQPDTEDYEKWKSRMLAVAHAQLAKLEETAVSPTPLLVGEEVI